MAAFAFPVALVSNFVAFEIGQRIFAGKHLQVTLGHPGVLRRSSSVLWQSASSPSSESVSAASFDTPQGRPLRWRSSSSEESRSASFFRPACVGTCPGTALQAAVTVHRSPGILTPGTAIVVLGVYAAIALAAASIRAAHRDA